MLPLKDILDAINTYCKEGVPVRQPVFDFMAINIAKELIAKKS